MAKSGSLKWCLLIVAFIALVTYHRINNQSSSLPTLGEPEGLDTSVQLKENEVYTGVPARDENFESFQMPDKMPVAISEDASQTDPVEQEESVLMDEFDAGFSHEAIEAELNEAELNNGQIINQFVEQSESLNQFQGNSVESSNKLPAPSVRQVPEVMERIQAIVPPIQKNTPAMPIPLPDGAQIKIVQHIEYGKSLARRGAIYGAQKEFQNALHLVAQALDYRMNTRSYSERLSSALLAMKEADDFYFAQDENDGRVDVVAIGSRHQSKIVTPEALMHMTPVDAMQAYYNFVQDQFVACSGHTVVAGEALYCLGKLFVVKSKNLVDGNPLDNAKAIVHHKAAIDCDNRNYKSANELAVLLAKTGRYKQAKKLLVHSLKVKQVARAWENLAFVHQQLGEQRLSQLALAEYQRSLNAPPVGNRIRWVSPEQFVQQTPEPAELRTAQAVPVNPTNKNVDKSSPIKDVLKRMF